MRMVHGLQHEVAVWGLLAEEDVVVIGLTLAVRGEPVAVEDPCVENDQPADVLGIDQPVELLALAAPGLTGLGPCDEGWARPGMTATKQRDLIQVGDFEQGVVEGRQLEPSGQLGRHPLTGQAVFTSHITPGFEIGLSSIRQDEDGFRTRIEVADEPKYLGGMPLELSGNHHRESLNSRLKVRGME